MDTTYSLKLPPKNYRRTIEELSVTIPDPVLKLKFLKQAINEYQKISSQSNLKPPIAEITFQKKLLDNAEELWPGSKKAVENLIRKDVITTPDIKSRWVYKLRYAIGFAILVVFILGVGTAVSPLVRNFNLKARIGTNNQQAKPPNIKIIVRKPVFYSRPSNGKDKPPSSIVKSANYQNEPGRVHQLFQNPILLALASRKYKNSKPVPFADLPLATSPSLDSKKLSPAAIVTPLIFQNEIERPLKFLQNPILLALASRKYKNSKPVPFADLPLVTSPSLDSKKLSPAVTVKPENFQNKTGRVLKFLQNPIWLALLSQKTINTKSDRITGKPLFSSLPLNSDKHSSSAIVKPVKDRIESVQVPEYLEKPIWLVEKTSDREIYSNRLQIITTHTIPNLPREYYRFPKNSNPLPAKSKISDKISGIVFHASESDLYPFMPEMNRSILKYSKQLIKYLLRKKSYHFFIDRFGRVYRLVQENHAAFHAGNSIWADNEEIYLNLNHAFIGICFEGKDFEEIILRTQKKGQTKNSKSTLLKPTGISSFNEAQLRSGKELTDWLRLKYKISQHNCVPHALTSVNPKKMLIGFHLDLSRGFPFTEFGLTDKYQEPLPSIVEFGFLYDGYFEKIFNGELWRGIRYSQEILQRQAANSGMSVADYRKGLHRRFSRLVDWKKEMHEKRAHLAINHQKPMGTKTP
jgi:hypothetical protein